MTELRETEHSFKTWDDVDLFYRAWQPPAGAKKALILFHRGHEHSGRFNEVVEKLNTGNISFFAWDARGHGRSPGDRGYAESFSMLVKDVDGFVRFVSKEYGIPLENIVVMALSVGSVIVSTWAHDYDPPIRGLILGTPALRVKLYVPLALPSLRLLQKLKPKSFIQSYVKPKMLTHDPVQADIYKKDPLITRAIATNILIGLFDASTRLIEDSGAIRLPTLMLSAGSDWVVELGPQKKFFEGLSSPIKEMHVYPGFFHDIFHEKDRHLPISKAREFLLKIFEGPISRSPLVKADKEGYTKDEYDTLCRPLSFLSPKNIMFGFQKFVMGTLGRMSEGIRIGWRTGFDSGQSLDYVYENRAKGFTPFGKLFDRLYLDSIGWKGIRQRKVNLEKMLEGAISKVLQNQKSVRILDIASGPGRYMLDALKKASNPAISAVLRDRSKEGLEVGKAIAQKMGVTNVTYAEGDAFDGKSIATISPRPDIAVVSGLYELFPDNGMVLNSLKGLSEAVPVGGYLIYTTQPWHPQVEMIARTLINRDGKPWIMRRRTQAEMDDLVRSVGFEKIDMAIDPWGIFAVSVARRLPS